MDEEGIERAAHPGARAVPLSAPPDGGLEGTRREYGSASSPAPASVAGGAGDGRRPPRFLGRSLRRDHGVCGALSNATHLRALPPAPAPMGGKLGPAPAGGSLQPGRRVCLAPSLEGSRPQPDFLRPLTGVRDPCHATPQSAPKAGSPANRSLVAVLSPPLRSWRFCRRWYFCPIEV
jgi:hypothetical protein